MDDSTGLLTEEDLAAKLRLPAEDIPVLRVRYSWPHVKLTRKTVRFTPDQVEAIIKQHSRGGVAPSPRAEQPVALPGQTRRSASRSTTGRRESA